MASMWRPGTSAAAGIKCIALTNREYYCPQLLRIAGLGAGAHTVVITTTNGGSGGTYSFLDWIAGTGDQSSFNTRAGRKRHAYGVGGLYRLWRQMTPMSMPITAIGPPRSPPWRATGSTCGWSIWQNSYNTATTMIQGGTPIHHNDTGHAYLAGKFFGAITA